MAKIKAQGTVLRISTEDADGTAYAGATMNAVTGLTSIGEPDGEAAEINTTDLNSTAKEFMMGLPDNGKFSISGQKVVSDAGQLAAIAARNAQRTVWVDITDSLGTKVYFKAVIPRATNMGAEVDGVVPFNATVRISGSIS